MGRPLAVAELVALVERLEGLLERAALSELEVEVGGTTLILRSPSAVPPAPAEALGGRGAGPPSEATVGAPESALERGTHAIVAPLTGIFYRSPSPGAEPYVGEGDQVTAGQVIGLIEAMKLFNEIKSDVTGLVRRLVAADGDLVKARQTLIEVEPA
jgi:acetyl-CoA carboxylase biotin carboxyl carrier protein